MKSKLEYYIKSIMVKPKKVLVQARIPEDVVITTREIIHTKGYSWSSVLEACLRKFVQEVRNEKEKD